VAVPATRLAGEEGEEKKGRFERREKKDLRLKTSLEVLFSIAALIVIAMQGAPFLGRPQP
jgi:hypothetical protein